MTCVATFKINEFAEVLDPEETADGIISHGWHVRVTNGTDSNPDNDWIITTTPGQISFRAPEGVSLKWGSLASFRFVADRVPVETPATLYVAGEGVPTSLAANTLSAVEILFRDGFESPEEGG